MFVLNPFTSLATCPSATKVQRTQGLRPREAGCNLKFIIFHSYHLRAESTGPRIKFRMRVVNKKLDGD